MGQVKNHFHDLLERERAAADGEQDLEPTGQQLAIEGGLRALSHAERENMDWGQRAYRAVLWFMERGHAEITIEQVKDAAYSRGLPRPPAEGAWGPVTKRLVREGRLEFSRYMESRNASQHGKPVKVWRVK